MGFHVEFMDADVVCHIDAAKNDPATPVAALALDSIESGTAEICRITVRTMPDMCGWIVEKTLGTSARDDMLRSIQPVGRGLSLSDAESVASMYGSQSIT